jgi:hypothetical protein
MKVGDVVVPTPESGRIFHCGSGSHTHAIIGSVDPFILVSEECDMVWSCTWQSHEVTVLGQASEEIQEKVRKRLAADKERGDL